MTPEQFCYWLNGFGELTTEAPTAEQWKAIKEHLATVFAKVTPPAPGTLSDSGAVQVRRDLQRRRDNERDNLGPGPVLPGPLDWLGGYPRVTC